MYTYLYICFTGKRYVNVHLCLCVGFHTTTRCHLYIVQNLICWLEIRLVVDPLRQATERGFWGNDNVLFFSAALLSIIDK